MRTTEEQDTKAKIKVRESVDSVIEAVSERIVNGEYPVEYDAKAVSALAVLVTARATAV